LVFGVIGADPNRRDGTLTSTAKFEVGDRVQDRAAFVLTTMPVDADYEVVVDAALAFGGMDQHHANSYCDPKSVWVLYKL
jgi:hypothetical protein